MKRILAALALAAAAPARPAPAASVVGSKHDLSVTGPGPIRALSERNVCIFCHVSHGGREGLFNRPDAAPEHQPYESSTMSARPGAPTGASRICLSCHDGTIAVGRTLRRQIPMTVSTIPAGRRSNLGTDLRGSHPISFRPAPGPRARPPAPGDNVRLDRRGEIQCTSCHDAHQEWLDPEQGKFLVKPNRRSAICVSCHDSPEFEGAASSHATATAAFGPAEGNEARFSSVGDAGCAACHLSHGGEPSGRLVRRNRGDEDDACLRCHSGTIARANVGREISKPFAHDGASGRGVHDAGEGRAGGRSLPEISPGAMRHVTCVDCHDPHMATSRPAAAPDAGGALAGVWGIDQNGQRVEQVQFEYEVCFKCHGDSANKRAPGPRPYDTVRRAAADANLRRVFSASSPSFHPVVAPAAGADVPSLRAPYRPGSMIYCSDCHASDAGPVAGGTGARGPHGSIYPYLLERNYSTADHTVESASAYALCYKCHDREKLLSTESAFPPHRQHVVDEATPCSMCHAAHGVSAQTGRPGENAHLIDFDLSTVSPGPGPAYESSGPGSGSCNLTCHGRPRPHTSSTHRY